MDVTKPECVDPHRQQSSGDAALMLVEVLLLALIDRGVVDGDEIVAEVESLAMGLQDGEHQDTTATVRGQLSRLANSIAAHRPR